MGLKQKKKCTDAKNNGNLIMKNECSKKQTPDHLITETSNNINILLVIHVLLLRK